MASNHRDRKTELPKSLIEVALEIDSTGVCVKFEKDGECVDGSDVQRLTVYSIFEGWFYRHFVKTKATHGRCGEFPFALRWKQGWESSPLGHTYRADLSTTVFGPTEEGPVWIDLTGGD